MQWLPWEAHANQVARIVPNPSPKGINSTHSKARVDRRVERIANHRRQRLANAEVPKATHESRMCNALKWERAGFASVEFLSVVSNLAASAAATA